MHPHDDWATLAFTLLHFFWIPATETPRPFVEQPKDDALITATVLDADTGNPIKTFRVVPGTPYNVPRGDPVAVWQPHLLREGVDGAYIWPTERSYPHFQLRFEADGYIPELSPWLKKADGPKAITLRLKRDPGISGRVLQPSGMPAAGASLAVGMPNRTVRLQNGAFADAKSPLPEKQADRWRRPLFLQADAQGQYWLPTEPSPAMIYVIHDTGIAEVSYEGLKQSTDIRLSGWGTIDGSVQWIDKPGVNEKLYLGIMRGVASYPEVFSTFLHLTTDAQGKFHVEKFPPWSVQISRSFDLPTGGGYLFPHMHVEIAAGKPTTVVFGGKGRPVVGKLTGLDSYENIVVAIRPNAPRPADKTGWQGQSLVAQSNIAPVFIRERLPVNKDGTFRIDHVIPQYYQLFVSNADNSVFQVVQLSVPAAPADQPDQPHQAGEIELTRRPK